MASYGNPPDNYGALRYHAPGGTLSAAQQSMLYFIRKDRRERQNASPILPVHNQIGVAMQVTLVAK